MTIEEKDLQQQEQNTGEVKELTATDILANEELMKQILASDTVKALVQSETDRVRTKAAKEKEMNMTEFEKYKAETDAKISELSKFQKDYSKMEALRKSGLNVELWDYVSGESHEDIIAKAKALDEKINKLAQAKVGANPQTSNSFQGITKEQFGKMSYSERAKLYQTDRELYEQLKK